MSMSILDQYCTKAPNGQNVIDIFKNEWSSKLPRNSTYKSSPGKAALFEDPRIQWAEQVFHGFSNLNILELGPLEGAHSYMLQNAGAASVLGIEANTRAYLKSLCIKEIFDLNKVKFLLGDFNIFLEGNKKKYDLIIAAGVLYHMKEPVRLLDLITHQTDKIYLQTHYYDHDIIAANPDLAPKFGKPKHIVYQEFKYEACDQNYNQALNWQGFCGGPEPESRWLTRQSIIDCLKYFEFVDMTIDFEEPDHIHGPIFSICASRKPKKSTPRSYLADRLRRVANKLAE